MLHWHQIFIIVVQRCRHSDAAAGLNQEDPPLPDPGSGRAYLGIGQSLHDSSDVVANPEMLLAFEDFIDGDSCGERFQLDFVFAYFFAPDEEGGDLAGEGGGGADGAALGQRHHAAAAAATQRRIEANRKQQ